MPTIQLSRNGITWTITGNNVGTNGQYINGDWWVVGPCTVNSVSPVTTGSGSSLRNGSMLNIRGDVRDLGHDGRGTGFLQSTVVVYPVNLVTNDTLVSCISVVALPNPPTPYFGISTAGGSFVNNIAILTIVASAPAFPSFRPSYCSNPSSRLTVPYSNVNISKLLTLPVLSTISGDPTMQPRLLATWSGGWSDHGQGDLRSSDHHPSIQMETYGRDMSRCINDTVMWLSSNFSNATKTPILLPFLQYGIDLWGMWLDKRSWWIAQGHNHSRLLPIVFMGNILGIGAALNPWSYKVESIQQIQEIDDTYFSNSTGWHGGKSLRYGFSVNNFEEVPIGNWTSAEASDSSYMWCCTWDEYSAVSLLLRILGLAAGINHSELFSCGERWLVPLDTNMYNAWNAVVGANPGTVGGLGTPVLDEAWTIYHQTTHHIPNFSRVIGKVASTNATLVMGAPIPTLGGSYTFEIYRCPITSGRLLVGDKLESPIINGNSKLWVNPAVALVDQAFTANSYKIAVVPVILPSFYGHAKIIFQAYWP